MATNLINFINKSTQRILRLLSRVEDSRSPKFYTKDIFIGHKFRIGEYTYGKPKVMFPDNENSNLIIGRYCSIAEEVTILLGGNHSTSWLTTYPFNKLWNSEIEDFTDIGFHSSTKGSVEIGNDVWIGYRVTILSGVTIGNGAIVAAGAVITKDIGPYEIWGGNPARLIRKRFNEVQIEQLEKIAWWDWSHDKVHADVRKLCSENVNEFINLYLKMAEK